MPWVLVSVLYSVFLIFLFSIETLLIKVLSLSISVISTLYCLADEVWFGVGVSILVGEHPVVEISLLGISWDKTL